MPDVDHILEGSYDLHAHGYPEIAVDVAAAGDMASCYAWAEEARDAGMAGFLIKSNIFPSITLAQNVDSAVDGIDVYGSTVFTPPSGGLNSLTAEIAGRLDSTIVYFPTWSAANDIELGGLSTYMAEYYDVFDPDSFDGVRILDDSGRLTAETRAVLDTLSQYDVTIGTGHLSPAESLELTTAATERGMNVIMQHPTSGSVNATVGETRDIAKAGAIIEFCALGTIDPFKRIDHEGLATWIRDVGLEHSMLSTDAFSEASPSPPKLLGDCLAGLSAAGLSTAELEVLVKENPSRVIGA